MTNSWFILRVSRGNPIKITDAINAVGLAQAYCPRSTTKRRHPFDRSQVIEVRKPLIPGYAFTDRHFDTAGIPFAMLALSKARGREKPSTIDCRVRWLAYEDHLLQISRSDLDALHESEIEPRATIEEIVSAFSQCVRGILPKRYVSLSEWRVAA